MIRKFIQGEEDSELFGIVGPLLVDRKIQAALGMAVTSDPGDVWLVDDGLFCLLRPKGEKIHLRFLFAEAPLPLIEAAIEYALDQKAKGLFTTDLETSAIWSKAGFCKVGAPRGRYVNWERNLL